MTKNKDNNKEENDPVVITTEDNGNKRAWKESELNEHQRTLIKELNKIVHKLQALDEEYAQENRNKQYRINDFVAAGETKSDPADKPEEK